VYSKGCKNIRNKQFADAIKVEPGAAPPNRQPNSTLKKSLPKPKASPPRNPED